MTGAQSADWDGIDTRKRQKTMAREAGAGLLLFGLLISIRYWFFLDVEMIKAFSAAYSGLMLIIIPTGISPFITTRIMQGKK